MNKILVNKKEFKYTENNFPIFIHGRDHEGASFYTISLIADLFFRDFEIVVLCGYPMAFEQFKNQVKDINDRVVFYTKEHIADFKNKLLSLDNTNNQIILLKNVELFDKDIINFVLERKNYIISGDFNKCVLGEKILEKPFVTKIFFSDFFDIEMPLLNKYEGFFVSDVTKGLTKLVL